MDKEIRYGYVFEMTEKAFKKGKKVIIHKGGTGSGKTYDLMLFLVLYVAMQQKGKIITIVSESRPHLDIGAIRIAQKILMEVGMAEKVPFNSSKGYFTFPTGSVIEFFSADRIEKALGARRYLLYGNEINSLKFEVWDELARRSEYIIGDFNPTAEFWLEKFLDYYGDNEIIKSNYLNNPFLPEVERQRIERRALTDSNFRRTHVDVDYGTMEGLIFEKWNQVDKLPEDMKWVVYGMDYGFSNDPTALIKVGMADGELWADELIYRTGMLARDIGNEMERIGIRWTDDVVSDNKPEAIYELRQMGMNVKAAYKPSGSIVAGIEAIKKYKLNVTKRSVNLIRELRNYRWKEDQFGKSVNIPEDKFNHAIDALRYAVMKRNFKSNRRMRMSRVSFELRG